MKKLKQFLLRKMGILSLKKKVEKLEKENKKQKEQAKKKIEWLEQENRAAKQRLDTLERCMKEAEKKNADLKRMADNQDRQIRNLIRENEKIHEEMRKQIANLERFIFSQNRGLAEETRTPRIIVSITSYPARIQVVSQVLERMLVQTLRPDKVVLWLSKEQFPNRERDLPEQLLDLRADGMEIGWCDGDLKAYKKVLPSLREYPDDIIIIIDDDLVYRVDFVENLYKAHLKHPEAIIASRVHQITFDEDGRIAPYETWQKECEYGVGEIKEDWFFTGGAGTLFPPKVLPEDVFDEAVITQLCPYADDIWLNIHAAMQHVPIVNIANNNHLTYIAGTQVDCLYDINKEQNDVQLKRIVEHYKDRLQDSVYQSF